MKAARLRICGSVKVKTEASFCAFCMIGGIFDTKIIENAKNCIKICKKVYNSGAVCYTVCAKKRLRK